MSHMRLEFEESVHQNPCRQGPDPSNGLPFEPSVTHTDSLLYDSAHQIRIRHHVSPQNDTYSNGLSRDQGHQVSVSFHQYNFVSLAANAVHAFTLLVFLFSALLWWGFLVNIMVECLMLAVYSSDSMVQAGAVLCGLTGFHFVIFPLFISIAVVRDVFLKYETILCYLETLVKFYSGGGISTSSLKPGFRASVQGVATFLVIILPLFVAGVMGATGSNVSQILTTCLSIQFWTVFLVMLVYIVAFLWVSACIEEETTVSTAAGEELVVRNAPSTGYEMPGSSGGTNLGTSNPLPSLDPHSNGNGAVAENATSDNVNVDDGGYGGAADDGDVVDGGVDDDVEAAGRGGRMKKLLYVERGVSIIDAALPRERQIVSTRSEDDHPGRWWQLWLFVIRSGLWVGLVFVIIVGVLAVDVSAAFQAVVVTAGVLAISIWMAHVVSKDQHTYVSNAMSKLPKFTVHVRWYILRLGVGVCLLTSSILFFASEMTSFGGWLLAISMLYLMSFFLGIASRASPSQLAKSPFLRAIKSSRKPIKDFPTFSRMSRRERWVWSVSRWLGVGMISLFLLLVLCVLGVPEGSTPPTLTVSPGDATQYWGVRRANESYAPMCDFEVKGLSMVDYAMLSKLAYARDSEVVQSALDGWFGAGKVTLLGTSDLTTSLSARFHDFVTDEGVRVISVRGSVTADDFFHDFDLWFESSLTMLLRSLYPFAEAFDFFYPRLIDAMSFLELQAKDHDQDGTPMYYYVDYVSAYLQEILRDNSNMKIVITGHSLGGGIASIVGANLRIPAAVFSAPGIYLSREKFGLHSDDIHDYTTNVWHGNDLVPSVDLHGRNLIHLECDTNVFSCHFMFGVLCDMRKACSYKDDVVIYDDGEFC